MSQTFDSVPNLSGNSLALSITLSSLPCAYFQIGTLRESKGLHENTPGSSEIEVIDIKYENTYTTVEGLDQEKKKKERGERRGERKEEKRKVVPDFSSCQQRYM